jgi:hypothetical protein
MSKPLSLLSTSSTISTPFGSQAIAILQRLSFIEEASLVVTHRAGLDWASLLNNASPTAAIMHDEARIQMSNTYHPILALMHENSEGTYLLINPLDNCQQI